MEGGGPATVRQVEPRRRFIRHTTGVPIEVRAVEGGAGRREQGVNVSVGGLSFTSDTPIPLGSTIQIRITEVDPPFEAQARVVWLSPEEDHYCVGVEFLEQGDAFRARMVEQVCAIEAYRHEQDRAGRTLTSPEAAAEWITRYAGGFPSG